MNIFSQSPTPKKGGAATTRNNRNEKGYTRAPRTSAPRRTGRLPGGAACNGARVREASQARIRDSRKRDNRGLLPERALSAKTVYETVANRCQVPRPHNFSSPAKARIETANPDPSSVDWRSIIRQMTIEITGLVVSPHGSTALAKGAEMVGC